jgi:hypothetical protein
VAELRPQLDLQHPQLEVRALFAPETINVEARTVELVWSTGAQVRRASWSRGDYIEELSLAPGHVRLDRLNSGAPLLNSHNSFTLSDVVGVVERAWIDGNEGRALVRFSDREEVEPIRRDVVAGIIRNVSVGYKIHKTERDETGAVPVERAVDWEPYELSLVPIPADAGAQVRSQDTNNHLDIMSSEKGNNNHNTDEMRSSERRRATDITNACRKAGLDGEFAEQLIADGTPINDARAMIIDKMAERQASQPQTMAGRVDVNGDKQPTDIVERLVRRFNGDQSAITAGEVMEAVTGQRGRPDVLLRGAMATTDFAALFAASGFKLLRDRYESAGTGARLIARRRQSSDLRDIHLLGLSEFPAMLKLLEGGEIKYGNFTDRGGFYRIEEYARGVNLTRRALLSDELDAFGEALGSYGRAIAGLEDDLVIAALESGGSGAKCMEDGKALFHADHANTTAETGLDLASLTEAAAKLREAKEVGNGRRLNLTPRWLLVSAQYEVTAIQLTTEINAAAANDVNPFAGGQLALMPLVDANLSGSHAYVLCDPSSPAAAIEVCSGPAVADVQSQPDFDTTSVKTRVLADRGLGVRDHRGIVRIPLSAG